MEGDSARLLRARAATYFNPLPPHGGRLFYSAKFFRRRIISIHSLRMEGDICGCNENQFTGISIHSLRMEGDRRRTFPDSPQRNFNPLPPHGGRPINCNQQRLQGKHFNPLPPHGGRPLIQLATQLKEEFQSTPSAWRETQRRRNQHKKLQISIHSLRMEGDYSQPSI